MAGVVHQIHRHKDFSYACVYHSSDVVNQHLVIDVHTVINFLCFINIAI